VSLFTRKEKSNAETQTARIRDIVFVEKRKGTWKLVVP
jgi:hypothetical protein